ncbi:MAG: MFS transporter [Rhizobiales bacterium]|nr:MFS transporter [Hyphomicrobiales bacterium]
MRTPDAASPPVAILSIMLSMSLLAIGSGLLFAYVPVKLAAGGYDPWVPGAVFTVMSVGAFTGCLLAGPLVRRVGPARVFAAMAALTLVSALLLTTGVDIATWLPARYLYGLASTGLFVATQSWLNDVTGNAWRGRVMAGFYTTYILCQGLGGFLIRYVSIEGAQAPLLAIWFITLAILPIALTRLATPPPPLDVAIAVRRTWRISPVGLVGLFASGGLSTTLHGFGPVYATSQGMGKDEIGLLFLAIQMGMLGVQMPLGALSDRIDRRYVLVLACGLVLAMGAFALRLDFTSLLLVGLVFAIWAGATETVYSVATAHANDRAGQADYVSLSSTLLVVWSTAAIIVPALATVLTAAYGPHVFTYVAMVLAAAYAVFVSYRLTRSEAVPAADQEPFQPMTGQVPLTPEVAASGASAPDRAVAREATNIPGSATRSSSEVGA